jgi:hypothetical protein
MAAFVAVLHVAWLRQCTGYCKLIDGCILCRHHSAVCVQLCQLFLGSCCEESVLSSLQGAQAAGSCSRRLLKQGGVLRCVRRFVICPVCVCCPLGVLSMLGQFCWYGTLLRPATSLGQQFLEWPVLGATGGWMCVERVGMLTHHSTRTSHMCIDGKVQVH